VHNNSAKSAGNKKSARSPKSACNKNLREINQRNPRETKTDHLSSMRTIIMHTQLNSRSPFEDFPRNHPTGSEWFSRMLLRSWQYSPIQIGNIPTLFGSIP